MRINASRLLERIDELAGIGSIPGGGVCRLAFSEEDKAGRDYIERRMRQLGLDVSIDPVGNILGIRKGKHNGPVVLAGSHTDTVGTGGRYDGSLGVLAGLEVIERMNEENLQTERPVGVISFVNEEGVRFMPDMMGSLFLRGDLTVEQIRGIVGTDGTTIGENMDRLDYAGADRIDGVEIGDYIELHIEQGPHLEAEDLTIGVVDGVHGICWLEIVFRGAANHAGATPMSMRYDAGYAAGLMVHRVRLIAERMGGDQRATVGSIRFFPNLINVIAEEASITVDLRNPDADQLLQAEQVVLDAAKSIARKERLQVSSRKLALVAPIDFDQRCVRTIADAANALGYSNRRMKSGAAHDAQILASKFPAAMIFIPSRGGVSHNVTEYSSPEHIEAGANVLFNTLLKLAGGNE